MQARHTSPKLPSVSILLYHHLTNALASSTMPPVKKQKVDRDSTAAYIASQPLFDALRNATTALSEQKVHLKTARDTVQALHVKVVNDDLMKHQSYLEQICASWASATESYGEIFHQITLITAEDASQGRPAASSHERYIAVLDSITTAKQSLKASHSLEEQVGDGSEEEMIEEEKIKHEPTNDSSSDSPPGVESSKTRPLKRPLEEDSAEEGAGKIDDTLPTTNTNIERKKKPAKTSAKARRKALKKAAAESAAGEQEQSHPDAPSQASASVASKIEEVDAAPVAPVVEFEDVEAVVDARVQAKAEKYAAKKARRAEQMKQKRKRESVDSLVKDEENGETVKAEPEPKSPVVEGQAEKPKKKKVKKTHVKVEDVDDGTVAKINAGLEQKANITASTESNAKAVKRKPDAAPVAVEGGGGKKRKTKHSAKD